MLILTTSERLYRLLNRKIKTMSWEGPDRERGDPKYDKPICTSLPPMQMGLPEIEQFEAYLTARDLDVSVAAQNGWYTSRSAEDSELRVVIPCRSNNLANKYWQARLLYDPKEKFPLRYQSPHGIRRDDAVVVVNPDMSCKGTVYAEGPMDALAAASIGYQGVAWMGTNPGEAPIIYGRSLAVKGKPVYIVADGDAIQAAVKIWQYFLGAHLLHPYPFKDLASMPPHERRQFLGQ